MYTTVAMDSSSSGVISAYSDPFYIHPSDNPYVLFFSPILTGDNYCSWVRGITMAMSAKDKQGFVDGTIPKPADKT